jgi:hypothetical protein
MIAAMIRTTMIQPPSIGLSNLVQSGEVSLLLEVLEMLLQGVGLRLGAPIPDEAANDNEEIGPGDCPDEIG